MGQILLTQGTPDFIHFHSVFNIYIGWWFGTCLFSIVYGIILPIDFHIFQDGSNHQPVYSKEDGDARKGRKVAIRCVFPMIWGFGGSKSRLAKAAGAEPAGQSRDEKLHAVVERSTFPSQNVQSTPLRCRKSARRCGAKHISKWKCTKHTSSGLLLEVKMSKKCTLLWPEAHFEVKMLKTLGVRTTFGSCDVEKGHAVVARSTFRSENAQNTPAPDYFWKLRYRKSARFCGAKHISKSKCTKHTMYEPFLEVQMSFRVAGARDCAACQKWANHEGFVAFRKTLASMGHLKIICKDAFFRGRGSTKDMCMREVGRSGRWFPERGCILEYQKCRFAKMILRDRCSTSYDLASIFRGRRSTSDRWSRKIAKRIGTRVSALHWSFHFWRKSRRSLWFLISSAERRCRCAKTSQSGELAGKMR